MKKIFHRVISFILTLALLGPLFQPLELHAKEFSYYYDMIWRDIDSHV